MEGVMFIYYREFFLALPQFFKVKLALLRNTKINMKSFCLSRKFQCHLYFFWQCKNDLLALLSGHKTDKSRLLRLFPDLNVFISFDQENIKKQL